LVDQVNQLKSELERQKYESTNMKEINKELLTKFSIASFPRLNGIQSSVQNLDYNTDESIAQFSQSHLADDLLEPSKIHLLY
jgi:uncharacterized protein YaaW (UPF0174 family)